MIYYIVIWTIVFGGVIMKKYVIDMNNSEAYDFFMKADSFCTLDLPEYFTFEPLLKDIENKLNGKDLSSFNSNISIKDNMHGDHLN